MPVSSSRSRRALLAATLAGATAIATSQTPGFRRGALAAQDKTAAERLSDAVIAMDGLTSFHFTFTTPRGESVIFDALELVKLEGDVLRPASFRTMVEARAAIIDLNLTVIGIDSSIWVSDPTPGSTRWVSRDISSAANFEDFWLTNLTNPDIFWLGALQYLTNATIIGENDIDGAPVTRIDGEINPRQIIPGAADAVSDFLNDAMVPVSFWLTAEQYVRRLEAEGPILKGEEADIIRRMDITQFNAPVVINPPGPLDVDSEIGTTAP